VTHTKLGLRLPGGISKPSDLWDLLYEERSGRGAFGKNQFNIEGYYHPNAQRPGSIHTKEAYLLRDSALLFDHTFFGMNSALVASMDPNQRKMLEVVYEALESAGEPLEKVSGANVGVFVGNMAADNQIMLAHDIDFAPQHASTGMSTAILSNRINHIFNLRGPRYGFPTRAVSHKPADSNLHT
jgi:acyl transferase domain-containing protein